MNTEAPQDQVPTTMGRRLRQARENMGLSQQTVAQRLCLKVSTVRDIEDDHANPNLDSTFLRGYIRSYARLVRLSEEELIPMMVKQTQQTTIKVSKVVPVQSLSLSKNRKKRDSWLMFFVWFILLVVIGLAGAWWWQNEQVQQQDIIANMAEPSSLRLSQEDEVTSVLFGNGRNANGNVAVMNFTGDYLLF